MASSSIPIPVPKSNHRSNNNNQPPSLIPPRPNDEPSPLVSAVHSHHLLGQSLPAHPKSILHPSSSSSSSSSSNNLLSASPSSVSPSRTPGRSKSKHASHASSTKHGSSRLSRRHHPRKPHLLSKDDMAAPSIELISRAARRWKSSGYSPDPTASSSSSSARDSLLHRFLSPWDFSEVVTATDQVRVAFENGAAIAKRPPRAGVSGTYFFCASDNDAAIGVFKPMDEEATSIDLCPSPPPPMYSFAPGVGGANIGAVGVGAGVGGTTGSGSNPSSIASSLPTLPLDSLFALGPAHCGSSVSPSSIACSPPPPMSNHHHQNPWASPSKNGVDHQLSQFQQSPNYFSNNHSAQLPLHSPTTLGTAMHHTNGFFQGEGAYREVAAYLLDHDRFAGVPQTALLQWAKPAHAPDLQPLAAASPSCTGNTYGDGKQHVQANLDFSEDDDEDLEEDDEEEDYSDYDDDDEDDDESDLSDDYSTDEDDEDEDNDFEGGTSPSANPHRPAVPVERNIQTKKGAFQVYVPNLGDADDFGPGVFDKAQVERIAVLDIRVVNHDRHGGNILVTSSSSSSSSSKYKLVPIDHGYILPDTIRSVPWPVWMDWPCVREPVTDEVRHYVQYLDADRDVRCLTAEFADVFALRPGALQTLRIATTLLQKGVAAGLSLYDIGLLMYARRDHPHDRSELEKLVSEAEEASRARASHLTSETAPADLASANAPHVNNKSGAAVATGTQPAATGNGNGNGNATTSSSPKPLSTEHHRRHQSSNAICDALLHDIHAAPVDDFVVKYVARRIQELVNRIAAAKAGPASPGASPLPSPRRKPASSSSSSSAGGGGDRASLLSSSSAADNAMADSDRDRQLELFFAGQTTTPFGAGSRVDSPSRSFNPLPSSSLQALHARPSFLTRARSIPDFGIGGGGSGSGSNSSSGASSKNTSSASIGAKPVHALIDQRSHNALPLALQLQQLGPDPAAPPAPTPASSPGAEHSTTPAAHPHPTPLPLPPPPLPHARARVARTPPIQIAINDERVNRIALPLAVHGPPATHSNSNSSSNSKATHAGGGRRSEFKPMVDGGATTVTVTLQTSGKGLGIGKGNGAEPKWFDRTGSGATKTTTTTTTTTGLASKSCTPAATAPVPVPVPVPGSSAMAPTTSSAKLPPLAPRSALVVPVNNGAPAASSSAWTQP